MKGRIIKLQLPTETHFVLSHLVQIDSEVYPALYQVNIDNSPPAENRSGRDANHSLHLNPQVTNNVTTPTFPITPSWFGV